MSWDAYLDNLVARSKDAQGAEHVDRACIVGLQDGGSLWTSAGHARGIKLSAPEAKVISQCFKDKNFSVFMASGVRLEGDKYQFLREVDGTTVYAKAKGKGSVTLQASKTAIIIAHCPEDKQQGNANNAVDGVVEYLKGLNI